MEKIVRFISFVLFVAFFFAATFFIQSIARPAYAGEQHQCTKMGEGKGQWYYSCSDGLMYAIPPGEYNQLNDPINLVERIEEIPSSVDPFGPFTWVYVQVGGSVLAFHPFVPESPIVRPPYNLPQSKICSSSEYKEGIFVSCGQNFIFHFDLQTRVSRAVSSLPSSPRLDKQENNVMPVFREIIAHCMKTSKTQYRFDSCVELELGKTLIGR